MSEILKFVLKGSRNYVQGTTLFNATVNAAAQRGLTDGNINITFKQMVNKPVCVLEERTPSPEDAVVARISGKHGESFTICINESSETVEACREEFNEQEVFCGAVLGEKSIMQENPHHQDRIELLVSLCKKMHQTCIDDKKKWIFSRYDGQFPIPSPEKVELRIARQVGTRLTCSDVIVNGQKIGDMYFS